MKGIKYYFLAPFLPRKTFKEFVNENNSDKIFWLVLLVHLILVSFLSHFNYSASPRYSGFANGFFLTAFLLGIAARTFFLAYILWESTKRIFHTSVPYVVCANIVLITLLPLSSVALFNIIIYPDYGMAYWLGMIYSSILITLAFTYYKNIDFSRMLALVIVSHFLYWVMLLPFAGMRF